MNYDAIVFDLDGTAIPNKIDGMPSRGVINAIEKANKKVKTIAATGRHLTLAKEIFLALNLVDLCIITQGTQIINPVTMTTEWEVVIEVKDVYAINSIVHPYGFTVLTNETTSTDNKPLIIRSYNALCIWGIPKESAKEVAQKLAHIINISAHIVTSWKADHVDIHISPNNGTKKHALQEVINRFELDPSRIIAVGDSNNDLPLFELAGLKVAMGNATSELKAEADIIAPTVDEDGLAWVVEKYIL